MKPYNTVKNTITGTTAQIEDARLARIQLDQLTGVGPSAENAICPDRLPVDPKTGMVLVYREEPEPKPLKWWERPAPVSRMAAKPVEVEAVAVVDVDDADNDVGVYCIDEGSLNELFDDDAEEMI